MVAGRPLRGEIPLSTFRLASDATGTSMQVSTLFPLPVDEFQNNFEQHFQCVARLFIDSSRSGFCCCKCCGRWLLPRWPCVESKFVYSVISMNWEKWSRSHLSHYFWLKNYVVYILMNEEVEYTHRTQSIARSLRQLPTSENQYVVRSLNTKGTERQWL